MKTLNIAAALTCGTLLMQSAGALNTSALPAKNSGMRDISTMELVRDMGIGINLGNTMEACGDWIADVDKQWGDGILTVDEYETAWGSPVITQAMIQGMADEGFGVVRVPVAWSNMMGDNYQISDELDERIHEIVDWVIDADMYCIINIHWDNGWVNTFPDNKNECMKRYETMWTQIADSFKDYGDKLMFESQNEELGWESVWNPWGSTDGKAESYALVNEINQKFVDIVRSSGSNNPQRHLLISGYNTGIDRTCDPLFKMPDDPADRMAVSVHYYTPAGFAILEDKDESWAKARPTWGKNDDFRELNEQMDMMKAGFVDKGIPVIIGEYGCPTKGKEADSVRLFLSSVCKAAYERQMCPVLWSTPDSTADDGTVTKGHYDRKTCKLADQQLKVLFNEICDSSQKHSGETTTTTSTTTATTTTTSATTVTETRTVKLAGDANCDNEVNMADAVFIMQCISNPDKYMLTDEGEANADVDKSSDITNMDALLIQKFKLGLVSQL